MVELGCGHGEVTKLILEKFCGSPELSPVAIDISSISLEAAQRNTGNPNGATVEFLEGAAALLSELIDQNADRIVFCNAIHYINNDSILLKSIRFRLKPAAGFGFNISFFHGSTVEGTEQFYKRWMLR